MSVAVSSVPGPRAAALARRELERTDFEVLFHDYNMLRHLAGLQKKRMLSCSYLLLRLRSQCWQGT